MKIENGSANPQRKVTRINKIEDIFLKLDLICTIIRAHSPI